jgi:hypothetical protein
MGPVKKTERSPSLCIKLSRKEFSNRGPNIKPIKKGATGMAKYLKIKPTTPAKTIHGFETRTKREYRSEKFNEMKKWVSLIIE